MVLFVVFVVMMMDIGIDEVLMIIDELSIGDMLCDCLKYIVIDKNDLLNVMLKLMVKCYVFFVYGLVLYIDMFGVGWVDVFYYYGDDIFG